MKRTFVAVLCLLASCLGNQAWAQGPGGAPAYTKVGVVNMGKIYSEYQRVKTLKAEMEKDMEPFKKKKEEMEKYIKDWTEALQKDRIRPILTPEQREQGPKIIIDAQRQLEDLEMAAKKQIGKKLENTLVILNKEINEHLQRYSQSHGYHLILAYGEPEVKLSDLKAWQRTMYAIDMGGMTVAYVDPRMDISQDIVNSLNAAFGPVNLNQPR